MESSLLDIVSLNRMMSESAAKSPFESLSTHRSDPMQNDVLFFLEWPTLKAYLQKYSNNHFCTWNYISMVIFI